MSKVFLFFVIISWVLVFSGHAVEAPSASSELPWITDARRLTGESVLVREAAIARLRKAPDLQSLLQQGLRTGHRFLALDVITALALKSMLSELIVDAPQDTSGYTYHALNTLMDSENQPELLKIYVSRLGEKNSPAVTVALLDSLARTQEDLKTNLLDRLFNSEHPEVRSAALYYVRSRVLTFNRSSFIAYLDRGIRDETFQIRLQALVQLNEMSLSVRRKNRKSLMKSLDSCRQDPVEEVKTLCISTAAGTWGLK